MPIYINQINSILFALNPFSQGSAAYVDQELKIPTFENYGRKQHSAWYLKFSDNPVAYISTSQRYKFIAICEFQHISKRII